MAIACNCSDNLILAASLRDPAVNKDGRNIIQIVLLNYIVAIYLIVIGLIGLFGTGSFRL